MTLKSTLGLGSAAAILFTLVATSEAQAACYLCFFDGGTSFCVPSGSPRAGMTQCTDQNNQCVLSGFLCGPYILEDIDADGSRTPVMRGPFAAVPIAAGTDGIARTLDCRGNIVSREFGPEALGQMHEQLDTIAL